ncbi:flagellar biosynthetic protein FliO [Sinomonas halotolerans]|uniref:Flagellar biosynthetic protein FliO n=1 Tax=Sinomonas halotolerans TaxID=1644133 RepID=A0ABU9WYR1_9MICC
MEDVLLLARAALALAAVLAGMWWLRRRLTGETGPLPWARLPWGAVGSAARPAPAPAPALDVVARRGLSRTASLVLVEADGERYLLGVTDAGVQVLGQRPVLAPGTAAPGEPGAGIPPKPAAAPSAPPAAPASAGFPSVLAASLAESMGSGIGLGTEAPGPADSGAADTHPAAQGGDAHDGAAPLTLPLPRVRRRRSVSR